MQVVVETPPYLKAAERLFSEEERDAIVGEVSSRPESGALIQGTGGFRKLRVARQGGGKRGSARVIYFFHNEGLPIFLVAAYAKNERASLSKAECNALAKAAEVFLRAHKR